MSQMADILEKKVAKTIRFVSSRRQALIRGCSIRAKAGFTLVELLAAMAIMVLVGTIVVAGLPSAHHAYIAAVDASNSQVLVSTTATKLRDELSVADPASVVVGSAGNLIEYRSIETGFNYIIKNNESKGIVIAKSASTPSESDFEPLVPASSVVGTQSGSKLISYVDSIGYVNGLFTVSGLQVRRNDGITFVNASVDQTLKIRSIAYG